MSKAKPQTEYPYIIAPLQQFAVPVDSLTPDPKNARKHNAKNIAAIKASLLKFKQYQPIIVQREGMIVRAGNGRLQAAKELGWTHIAALVVDADNVESVSLAITDNWTADTAEWNVEVLLEAVSDLAGTDFAIAEFSDDDLARLSEMLQTPDLGEFAATSTEESKPAKPKAEATDPSDSDEGEGDSDSAKSKEKETSAGNFVIHYDIVFDTTDQRERFQQLLRTLKKRYPAIDTVAGRLDAWIKESEAL